MQSLKGTRQARAANHRARMVGTFDGECLRLGRHICVPEFCSSMWLATLCIEVSFGTLSMMRCIVRAFPLCCCVSMVDGEADRIWKALGRLAARLGRDVYCDFSEREEYLCC